LLCPFKPIHVVEIVSSVIYILASDIPPTIFDCVEE
jgi:hypothetical protein